MSIYNQILENKLKELAKGGSAVAKQELLIQKKKREIEAKLKNAQTALPKTANVGLKLNAPKKQPPQPPLPLPQIKVETPRPGDTTSSLGNSFKNDGSFLEQFRRMQSMKGSTSTPPATPTVTPKPEPDAGSSSPQPVGLVIKLQAPAPPKTLQPSAVADQLNEDDDDDEQAAPAKGPFGVASTLLWSEWKGNPRMERGRGLVGRGC